MKKNRDDFLRGMKGQYFGIEVEMTGITQFECRQLLAGYFSDSSLFDSKGRDWSVHGDSSIIAMRRNNRGGMESADSNYRVEMVSPILEYDDIPMLQEIIRLLRRGGGVSDAEYKCGIHVHVGDTGQNKDTLRNMVKLMRSKQYLLERALQIPDSRLNGYCRYVDDNLANRVNKKPFKSMDQLKGSWLENCDRYRMLNLSSFFDGKGLEFRLFNGTLHAGKIKSYVQLSLALAQSAKDLTKCQIGEPKNRDNDKYSMRNWLNRMHLTGEEFKTLRKVMIENLSGESAFASSYKRKAMEFVALTDDHVDENLPFY